MSREDDAGIDVGRLLTIDVAAGPPPTDSTNH